jgi:hypothetical protein
MADPPGTVLVTAVPDWVRIIAREKLSPGVTAIQNAPYVIKFHTEIAVTVASSIQVMSRITAQTLAGSTRLNTRTKIPMTSSEESVTWMTRRERTPLPR